MRSEVITKGNYATYFRHLNKHSDFFFDFFFFFFFGGGGRRMIINIHSLSTGRCPHVMWTLQGCVTPKVPRGHFLGLDFFIRRCFWQKWYLTSEVLSRGYILDEKKPANWRLGAKLLSVFENYSCHWSIWDKFFESHKSGLMIRKGSLSKGMFLTKFSSAKGIQKKTRAMHPSFFQPGFRTNYKQFRIKHNATMCI